ncbi:hypothetical protein SB748_25070 [Rhizobium sp. SIMBA_035]
MHRRELGRRRLAMRLPKVRSRIMHAAQPWQLELFEAYELAVEYRELMRINPSETGLFEEYCETCLDIERDVARFMTDTRSP